MVVTVILPAGGASAPSNMGTFASGATLSNLGPSHPREMGNTLKLSLNTPIPFHIEKVGLADLISSPTRHLPG
jgi:hypothetical protein